MSATLLTQGLEGLNFLLVEIADWLVKGHRWRY